MEPKRQKRIWAGAGLLFVLAVGTGYIPDLMLGQEMAAAQAEGFVQMKPRTPAVPVAKNAYVAYDRAIRRNMPGLNRLVGDPTNQMRHPEPVVLKLYAEVTEASKLSAFAHPAQTEDAAVPYIDNAVPFSLPTVALGIAASARSFSELETAARIAKHLGIPDPASVPSASWAKIAEKTLDTAKALHLPPEERRALIEALGPLPDLRESLRQHVVAVLQSLEDPTRAGSSGRRIRERIRYLKFWREFLRTLPKERAAFVKAVAVAEPRIAEVEQDVGIYRDFARGSSSTPWKDWARETAKVLDRLESGAK